ncbi:hypothetical protein KL918_003176 [Ogataea parapolymorpha]|uniref:Ribosome assembly protein 3 n=1 Tax=Ogataea parapolymorpha (strain ATCC 26012 / BCRC 20466 / JCM 22074 / NRRL Y-7560 / DL-1) TaxID=871575 RepID=RSA3_OGAPD|nr:Ribosome assembly protein 3 [Ogataea parapolymorpha DL-1]Q5QT59.1 RecName: Full=Ribosome assembly protein 3 [Ogataea parapolymorpha DL-1]AAQ06629.1 unknown [Ogataea angusta]KAG7866981.1 hypothetical protein KL918_003176 [Ogataea parapolymorpha]ESW97797.1 Ribosome assembly protein 3 [Ogataea parapolymorpha DL-1]KAG7872345.1 hypothetical protein KL916_003080 [Ogataea parapolymorpha]
MPNRRARKKRRTEDFSSSSASENDSDSESVTSVQEEQPDAPETYTIDGLDTQEVSDSTQVRLQQLNADRLASIEQSLSGNLKLDINAVRQIDDVREQLQNEYLKKLLVTYSEDLDALRQKTDFKENSLKTLARLLKESGNIFDDGTLKSLVE